MNIRKFVAAGVSAFFQHASARTTGVCRGKFLFTGALIVLFLGTVSSAVAAEKTLHGHVPAIVRHLTPVSRLPASKELHLAIGVPLRNPGELDVFLKDLYNPASPNFRQYLTPQQFTEAFGPTEDDYNRVKNFAMANGLTITATHGNRLLLDVGGSVASMEKAFHVTFNLYHHPRESRDFYAPDREPTVDASLPIIDVSGMDNYELPHPKNIHISPSNLTAVSKAGSGQNGSYIGNDFRNAYVPGTVLNGSGQMVGLLQFDGFYQSDITAYETAAGRTNIPVQAVLLDGYDGTPSSGNIEVSLDIEMAMAVAPALAKIVVFEGGPSGIPNDILNSMAASNTIKNLSCSWGWSGGPSTTTENIFKQMASQGQSFFNASGDSDAFTPGQVDDPSYTGSPSSSPNITQVGGTTLTMSGSGAGYSSETVWNWGGGTGSSGGISSYYSIPAWQQGVNSFAANGGSVTMRNIPDVALTADQIYVKYGNGSTSTGVGGTSCAAPLWAGFMALVNQQAVDAGKSTMGFINPAIYEIANESIYRSAFHDVITGNNTSSSSPSLFYAVTGYDLCTGLGTPSGTNLINALVNPDSLIVSPAGGFSASGMNGGPFTVTSTLFAITNGSSGSLNWSVINPASWLSVSPASGTLAAGGSNSVTVTLNSAASNLVAGVYYATIWFTNATSGVGHSRLFVLQVNDYLSVSPTNTFTSSGAVGGPFTPTVEGLVLTNAGPFSLNWSVVNNSSWLTASPATGTLTANGHSTLSIGITRAATNFVSGTYSSSLQVSNQNSSAVQTITVQLFVGQPLVQNGGFETGDFTGWSLNGTAGYTFVTNSAYLTPHAGTYSALFGQPSSPAYLSQSIPTAPGQAYLLSLWLNSPSYTAGTTPNEFAVSWNGNTLYDYNNVPVMTWTNLLFIVTASSGSTVLQIGGRDDPWYLGLDDVSVVPIPQPSSVVVSRTNNVFKLSWNAVTNVPYVVQYKTNLLQTNWINLGTTNRATNVVMTATNAMGTNSQRFYRVIVP